MTVRSRIAVAVLAPALTVWFGLFALLYLVDLIFQAFDALFGDRLESEIRKEADELRRS